MLGLVKPAQIYFLHVEKTLQITIDLQIWLWNREASGSVRKLKNC